MEVAFVKTFDHVRVYRSDVDSSVKITAQLDDFIFIYGREYNRLPNEIYGAVCGNETPEWSDLSPFEFIKNTIEGQHLLEAVVSEVSISEPLSLEPATTWARTDMNKRVSDNDSWKEVNIHDAGIDDDVLGSNDKKYDKFVYTIKLVDSDDNEVYYVGDTTQPNTRLRTHIRERGDFAYANQNDLSVSEIVEIRPESELTEREKYEEVKAENPTVGVYGGR